MDFLTEPFLRYIAKTTYFIDASLKARDCRILYILSGNGIFESEKCKFNLKKGTLVYYPAYTAYHITSESEMLFYTLNFDFTNARCNAVSPMVPDLAERVDGEWTEGKDVPPFFRETRLVEGAYSLEPVISALYDESIRPRAFSQTVITSIMKLMLVEILRHGKGEDKTLVSRIRSLVDSDPKLNNVKIAAILGYHPYYINTVFSRSEGVSLHKYIMRERLVRAKELITLTDTSVEHIAYECGFSSASHLSSAVRREYGVTPSGMRKA